MADTKIGKKAEAKIKEWLDHPDQDISFDRIPDQTSGLYGSSNICDFAVYRFPYDYYIESKATWEDRFDFAMITDKQHEGLFEKSQIGGAFGWVIVLFAYYKRAFVIDIREIYRLESAGVKSLNIKKIDKWGCRYSEIQTVPSRKELLDYTGDLEDHIAGALPEGVSVCVNPARQTRAHAEWRYEAVGPHKGVFCTHCQHFDGQFFPNGCMHYCPYCGAEIDKWEGFP